MTTRESWNHATRNHNAHKGDQAAFLRNGGDTLFDEEFQLLGDLQGRTLLHLQCNAGQDTLCLARRGAVVTGVDFSSEAIGFARGLSRDTQLPAQFVEADALDWLEETSQRFDVAFSSYGAVGWLPDLTRWARGLARVLNPGGRFVYVEFHPLVWSVGKTLRLDGDDYFAATPFVEPVGDYVMASGAALGALTPAPSVENTIPATSWQYGLGQVVTALAQAGLVLETLVEWPYSNGCKVHASLVPDGPRRWKWPEGCARVPLMFGVVVRRA